MAHFWRENQLAQTKKNAKSKAIGLETQESKDQDTI
jgi:hypothetical protein